MAQPGDGNESSMSGKEPTVPISELRERDVKGGFRLPQSW